MPIGESVGLYMRSISGSANTTVPYDYNLSAEDTTTKLLYSSINPATFATEYGALPLKMSLKYNVARVAFYGMRGAGVLSSLNDPFNPARQAWKYHRRHVTGLTGKMITAGRDIVMGRPLMDKARTMGHISKITDILKQSRKQPRSFTRFLLTGQVPAGIDTREVIKPAEGIVDKLIFNQQGMADAMKGKASMGVVERYLLKPNELMESLNDISPDLYKFVKSKGGSTELANNVLSKLYADHTRRHSLFKSMSSVKGFRSKLGALRGSVKSYWLDRAAAKSDLLAAQDVGKIFVSDIMPLPFRKRDRLSLKEFFDKRLADEGGRRKVALWRTRFKMARPAQGIMRATEHAFMEAAKEKVMQDLGATTWPEAAQIGRTKGISVTDTLSRYRDDIQKGVNTRQRYMLGVVDRMKRSKMIRRVAGTTMGLGIIAATTSKALTAAIEVPSRMAGTLRKITMPEFGSGRILQNSALATERQRAVQAIQNAQMNARTLIGNEANLYH